MVKGPIVLINTFRVKPDQADELVALLSKATESSVRHLDGFVSARIHLSLDRKHVALYSRWESQEQYEQAQENTVAKHLFEQAASVADSFNPILYQVKFSDVNPSQHHVVESKHHY